MLVPFDEQRRERMTMDTVKEVVREQYGVEIVDGFLRPLNEEGRNEQQDWPIASFRHVHRAWKVDHHGNSTFSWLTYPLPTELKTKKVVFVFPMGTGYGTSYPEPSGWFELYVNRRLAVRFREIKYSELWRQGNCELFFDVIRYHVPPDGTGLYLDPWINGSRMASFGIAVLQVPTDYVKPNESARVEVRAKEYFPSHTWVRIDEAFGERTDPEANLRYLAWENGLQKVISKKQYPSVNGKNVYFGDIHAHSFCGLEAPCGRWDERNTHCYGCTLSGRGNGCGWGTINANYLYARDVANLDFFTLAEHGFQMPGHEWKRRVEVSNKYNVEGSFVVVTGYEHTSWLYGHRNVYFLDDDPPMFPASPTYGGYGKSPQVPPEELWEFMESRKVEFFTVPHHPTAADHPFCWDRFNPRYDKNVEIYSGWGSSETTDTPLVGDGSNKFPHLTVRNAVRKGLQFGFVAGSDSHDGCPGNAQGIAIFNWANKFSKVGSGRTAVICDSLTREDVYNAMKNRSCYATTWAPIIVDFRVNGAFMGSELTAKGQRQVMCRVSAPTGISKMVFIKNGIPVLTVNCENREQVIEFKDKKELDLDTYYVRVVLNDMETAWSSPVFVKS